MPAAASRRRFESSPDGVSLIRGGAWHCLLRMNKAVPGDVREVNVCGWPAVAALFARHPEEIRRLFFDPGVGKRAGAMSRWMAERRRVYRQVGGDELERIAGTVHHGGIVAVISARPLLKVTPEVIVGWAQAGSPLLLLDRISNANNVGAIVRTAAFFGVCDIILSDHPAQALPGEAAFRVAEGGMEFARFHRVPSLPELCVALRGSHTVIGTSVSGNQLSPSELARRGLPRPPAIVLGNEERGIAPSVAAACERLVRIPGAGTIESLNVSAAAAVLCWELAGKRDSGTRLERFNRGTRGKSRVP